MSSAVNVFVHAIRKCLQKCLVQKVGNISSLGPIAMIQQPFCSSCVALQYEPKTKFSIELFPSYTLSKLVQNFISTHYKGLTYGTACTCLDCWLNDWIMKVKLKILNLSLFHALCVGF